MKKSSLAHAKKSSDGMRVLGVEPTNNESKLCCAGWRHTARYAKRWYR